MSEHTTKAFDADLQELTFKIAEMGRIDEKQLEDAIEALARSDAALAMQVVTADDKVDALQHEIEQKAVLTIGSPWPLT